MARFHSPKNFTALQWECTRWVGNPKMFHCLCLKGPPLVRLISIPLRVLGWVFLPGLLLPSSQWTSKQQEFFFRLCVCWRGHTSRSCWVLTSVAENSDASWNVLEVAICCLPSWSFSFLCLMAFYFYEDVSSLSISTESGIPSLALVMPWFGSVPVVHSCVLYLSLSSTSLNGWVWIFFC